MRMSERLPHLTALRVFESSARHRSFQAAAAELGLSPSAVSHQIRALERYLDTRLFERRVRAVELTEAGQALWPRLAEGFRLIESGVRQVRTLQAPAQIQLSAGPAIAAKWLVPLLHRFAERHPTIDVRVSTSNKPVDLKKEAFDVAIRHGRGNYAGLEAIRLFGEAYAPMCSPALHGDKRRGLRTLEHLRDQRLLHDDHAAFPGKTLGWCEWLKAAGARGVDCNSGVHYSQTDHAIQAALDGSGVLLGRMAIAAFDLAAGRLVRPFDLVLPSLYGYYFVTLPGRSRERAIGAFLGWLQEEVRATPNLPP
jgi:LysR family glycine cleavage system transcriptional activator